MTIKENDDSTFARRVLGQSARIDRFVEDDGPARGARRLRMVTGGGLEIEIHPDRALDIGRVTFDGIPVAFTERGGVPAPLRYNSVDIGWVTAFGGGLMVTCGLDAYGAPSIDQGSLYPQHGSVSGIPASVTVVADAGEILVVEGLVRQFVLGGQRLTLRRRLESTVGGTDLRVHDRVTNESARTSSVHMMMYHVNFGWPLLGPGAEMILPDSLVEGRDDVSTAGIAGCRVINPPTPDHEMEVFLHEFPPGGPISVGVRNPALGLEVLLDFDRTQLPYLCEWKYFSYDAYVLGLEPINTRTVSSRADAREKGALRTLAPGESAEYDLTFRFRRIH
jgi:hypothetical protein